VCVLEDSECPTLIGYLIQTSPSRSEVPSGSGSPPVCPSSLRSCLLDVAMIREGGFMQ